MDQNDKNQLPTTPAVHTAAPAVPAHEPITTVQQPSDAPVMPIAVEAASPAVAPATPTEAPAVATAPSAAPIPAHESPIVTEVHTATGNQPHKKPVMMLVGIFIIVMLVAGGAIYVMGLSNNTKRLGATMKKPVQPVMVQPTETPLPEETELNSIDTTTIDTELQHLDTDVASLN